MLLNCDIGEDFWESLGEQGDPTSPSKRKSVLNIHWKDWCWSWNSNTLPTWWEELTHLKNPSCWEGLKAGGEGDDRGWDGWMTSPTQWTWIQVSSRSWWWMEKPGILQSMGSQKVVHDWATELNWNVMCLNLPKTIPPPPSFMEVTLPWKQPLMPKRLEITSIKNPPFWGDLIFISSYIGIELSRR